MGKMRIRLITLCAFFTLLLSLILLIWFSSGFQISPNDLAIVNWNVLGFGWQSLGVPAPTIVSADATVNGLYVSTFDRRIFYSSNLEGNRPVWEQMQAAPRFDQPPRLLLTCGLIVADGSRIYSYSYSGQWKQLTPPLIGAVRGMLDGLGGVLLEGDTQILYSQDCGATWQELWNGDPLQSNMTATATDLIVASNGRILALSLKWDVESRRYRVGEQGWRDISGILTGKPIRFLAVGVDWFIAATDNQVYRSTLVYPLGTWEPFSLGLPIRYQVTEISSQHWDIGLKTDQGLYILTAHGQQWSRPLGFGNSTIYLAVVQWMPEHTTERTYVISDNNIWTYSQGSIEYGALLNLLLLYVCQPVLVLSWIALGLLLARRTNRRLKTSQ